MLRVAIVGSGNWGTTIAKIVGSNVARKEAYHDEVRMWVHEEMVDGKKLTEIINTQHENVRYLPGIELPKNVVAVPDLCDAIDNADVLVFVIPHQFLGLTLKQMKPKVKPTACGVSLIKGLATSGQSGLALLTDNIRDELKIPCAVLMGANLAWEVAQEYFCEATLAIKDDKFAEILKPIFQTEYFRIAKIKDEVGAELCGALKNIVAVAAGIVEGLGYGDNTKAAVIRLGFMEMKRFMTQYFCDRHFDEATLFESCGVADLITTCYGGRNKQIGKKLATTSTNLAELEATLLNGQSAQGPLTAAEVVTMLEANNFCDEYPLFTLVHRICQRETPPQSFLKCFENHPEHR